MDLEQVAHADLRRLVHDELVVEQRVGPLLAHARPRRRAHGHRDAVPEGREVGGDGGDRRVRGGERDG